jgi:hypothetical protein
MQCIRGVKAVANLIKVTPAASAVDIQNKIVFEPGETVAPRLNEDREGFLWPRA